MDELMADGLIVEVLYGIDKVEDLQDPQTHDRFVNFMINRRYFPHSIGEYEAAVDHTLRAGRLGVHAAAQSDRFSEAELLDFLRSLRQAMADRKPWPRPAFVKVPVSTMAELADLRVVATVDRSEMQLEGLLNKRFDLIEVGTSELPVMLLELRSGDRAAVIGSVDPRQESFSLMGTGVGDPGRLIGHFVEMTGISPEQVSRL